MDYQIEIKDIEPIRIAYMRYKGVVTEANKVFPNVFKSIRGKSNGAPFFNYIAMNPETKIGEIELCVPTNEIPVEKGVDIKEIPRIKAVCLIHVGSYETLNKAYEAIDKYAIENGIELCSPFREVIFKGTVMFLKGNPDKYLTEIHFPIKVE